MHNVIIIVLDDLGYKDLGSWGSELYTPNLDQLCNSSIKFTQFNGQPICSPSRASLMTSLFVNNNGIQSMIWPWLKAGLDLKLPILPTLLKQEGYSTYMVGKWHLGFFNPAYQPQNRGFDYHYGSYSGWVDYWKHTNYDAYDVHENGHIIDQNNNEHMTELCANRAINIINNHNTNNPFFLYLPFNAPHIPLQTFPYWTSHVDNYNTNITGRKDFAGLLSHLDYCLGKIINTLKNKNLFNNTFIWVTSDNGGGQSSDNGLLRNIKATFYEGGIRIPNFLLGPGIIPTTNDNPYHIVDMMPTIFKLLDLPFNITTDGVDVFAPTDPNREFVYYARKNQDGNVIGAIRKGNYKFLKFETLEMYDLINDPYEKDNIINSQKTERDYLLNRLTDLASNAKWIEGSNAWTLRPNVKNISELFNNKEIPIEENSMKYALGLQGFSSID